MDRSPLDQRELLQILHAYVREAGTQAAAARRLRISVQYLCDVLGGRRRISARLARALGYRQRVVFDRLES